MKLLLFFSAVGMEDHPPAAFDPFPGAFEPLAAVLLVVLIVLLVWWLLRFQVGQVEPVDVGHGHGHGDEGHHEMAMHAPAAMAAHAPAEMAEAVAPAPAEMAAEPIAETQTAPDDLKILEGVGPKVETVLNAAGITTFAQLAGTGAGRLKEILEAAEYGYMDPASWPEQARLAAAGDLDGLKKLQDDLKGGR